jgi:cytochrome c551/c552
VARSVLAGLLLLLTACAGAKADRPKAREEAGEEAREAAREGGARGAIFVEKGCPQCHSISAFGIKSKAEVGPDLTNAYADVQTRFGVKLEQFLPAPTGTMQMVLSSMIKLTPAERDSIIHILKELHEEREEHEGKHQ